MGKVIEIHPIAGKIVYTNPVWQWDYGCFLHLNDIDLPFSYQAEFSNTSARGTAKSYTQTTDMVEIPKSYQESGEPIYIWIVLIDEESRITEYMINVAVNPRSKSEEGEPTPEEQSEFDSLRSALNNGVSRVEGIAAGIQNTITDALTEAKESGEFDGKDGYTPQKGIDYFDGEPGKDGADGYTPQKGIDYFDGKDGIDGKDGKDGADGQTGPAGAPGISPSITITDIMGGHRVTITDATGQHSFDVMDSKGAVQDVQVNGVSVLTDGVANVPLAVDRGATGVVKINRSFGITEASGFLSFVGTPIQDAKTGTSQYRVVLTNIQHASAFYGLAKAAGSDEKNSSLPVGQYTDAAKSAIHTMLNGPVSVTGTTPSITALAGIQYICGEVTTLDITLPASGCVDVVFQSGSTPTVLTITPPTGHTVKWANGFDPNNLEANATYEINIKDGLGVAGAWT